MFLRWAKITRCTEGYYHNSQAILYFFSLEKSTGPSGLPRSRRGCHNLGVLPGAQTMACPFQHRALLSLLRTRAGLTLDLDRITMHVTTTGDRSLLAHARRPRSRGSSRGASRGTKARSCCVVACTSRRRRAESSWRATTAGRAANARRCWWRPPSGATGRTEQTAPSTGTHERLESSIS